MKLWQMEQSECTMNENAILTSTVSIVLYLVQMTKLGHIPSEILSRKLEIVHNYIQIKKTARGRSTIAMDMISYFQILDLVPSSTLIYIQMSPRDLSSTLWRGLIGQVLVTGVVLLALRPLLWNSLPQRLKQSQNVDIFKRRLKMWLFNDHFGGVALLLLLLIFNYMQIYLLLMVE
jgi:hypothetical protein